MKKISSLKDNFASSAASLVKSAGNAFSKSVVEVTSLCMIGIISVTILGFSQTSPTQNVAINVNIPRVVTSSTGELITVKFVGKTADSLMALRASDNSRINIPFSRLCDADRELVMKWDPTPVQNYKPSSVTMAPNGSSSGLGMGNTYMIPRVTMRTRRVASNNNSSATMTPSLVSTTVTSKTYMVAGPCCNKNSRCPARK